MPMTGNFAWSNTNVIIISEDSLMIYLGKQLFMWTLVND